MQPPPSRRGSRSWELLSGTAERRTQRNESRLTKPAGHIHRGRPLSMRACRGRLATGDRLAAALPVRQHCVHRAADPVGEARDWQPMTTVTPPPYYDHGIAAAQPTRRGRRCGLARGGRFRRCWWAGGRGHRRVGARRRVRGGVRCPGARDGAGGHAGGGIGRPVAGGCGAGRVAFAGGCAGACARRGRRSRGACRDRSGEAGRRRRGRCGGAAASCGFLAAGGAAAEAPGRGVGGDAQRFRCARCG